MSILAKPGKKEHILGSRGWGGTDSRGGGGGWVRADGIGFNRSHSDKPGEAHGIGFRVLGLRRARARGGGGGEAVGLGSVIAGALVISGDLFVILQPQSKDLARNTETQLHGGA